MLHWFINQTKIGYAEPTTLSESNIVIPMVSSIMKTPYKINIDTLEFIYKFGIKKILLQMILVKR